MSVQIYSCNNPFPEILKELFHLSYQYTGPLDEIHHLLDSPLLTDQQKDYHKQLHEWTKDRDSIFVKRFHEYVDKYTRFNESYYDFIHKNILPLFPNETHLVIQKTPNIRFSLPNNAAIGCDPKDPANIVGLHCDSDFGHHHTEQNFIIPITPMFESNSIYYEPHINSQTHPNDFERINIQPDHFIHAYFNKLRHCNRINQTNKTRISFDIRVIPHSQYRENFDYFQNTKFELGKYYMVISNPL